MLNIWASVIHLSDVRFSSSESKSADLDFLISQKLHKKINFCKQTWMMNPVWRAPGTTAVLLRDSYRDLRDSKESYLVLVTPGFADVLSGVSTKLVQKQLDELAQRARVFNKRIITIMIGVPPGSPVKVAKHIGELNRATFLITKKYNGVCADLRNLQYSRWDGLVGSSLISLDKSADIMADAILKSHP